MAASVLFQQHIPTDPDDINVVGKEVRRQAARYPLQAGKFVPAGSKRMTTAHSPPTTKVLAPFIGFVVNSFSVTVADLRN
jgi:hypothetical protein